MNRSFWSKLAVNGVPHCYKFYRLALSHALTDSYVDLGQLGGKLCADTDGSRCYSSSYDVTENPIDH